MIPRDRDYDPRRIRGVFFDLHGTLFEFGDMDRAWSDWYRVLSEILRRAGLQAEEAALAEECAGLFRKPYAVRPDEAGRYTVYELRVKDLCRRLGFEPADDALTAAAEESLAAWHRQVKIDKQVYGVLKALKGEKRLALVSNFDHPPHINRLVKEFRLDFFFESVTVSAEVGFWKPDPRIFGFPLKATGLSPREVVYVGDSEEDDVQGARAAGLFPILIRRYDRPVRMDYASDAPLAPARPAAQPVAVIKSLNEIFKHL